MDAGAMAAARRWNDALKHVAGGGGRRRRRRSGLGVGVLRPTGLKKMNRVIENSALRPAAAADYRKALRNTLFSTDGHPT